MGNQISEGGKTNYGPESDHLSQQVVKCLGKCELIKYKPLGASDSYSSIFANIQKGKFITMFRLPMNATNVEICYGGKDHGQFTSVLADTWYEFSPHISLPMDKSDPFFFNADQQIHFIELTVISEDK